VVILDYRHDSTWQSCVSITRGLRRAYFAAFPGARVVRFHHAASPAEVENQADQVLAARPEGLALVDHRLPVALLQALRKRARGGRLPPLTLHVFGNFTSFLPDWATLEPVLSGQKVRLVAASAAQRQLLSEYLQAGSDLAELPFPVDARAFRSPRADDRAQARRALGIAENERVLCYAGRISLQKNILLLIERYARAAAHARVPTRLLLCGEIDDLGAPHFGLLPARQAYHFVLERQLALLPESIRRTIHRTGPLEPGMLRLALLASDQFVSLSLHHDEDFGMAPAEALACGTPALLTAWGGFAGLGQRFPSDVRLIPTGLTARGPWLDQAALDAALSAALGDGSTEAVSVRRERSARVRAALSVPAVADELRALHARRVRPFPGFREGFAEEAAPDRLPRNLGSTLARYRLRYRGYVSAQREAMAAPRYPLEDWRRQLSWLGRAFPARNRRPGTGELTRSLRPASLDGISPLNPVFSDNIASLRHLDRAPIWLLRDGAISLAAFFRAHPVPPRGHSRILVRAELLRWVPQAWRSRTGTYRPASARGMGKRRPILMVTASSHPTDCPPELALRRLREVGIGQYDRVLVVIAGAVSASSPHTRALLRMIRAEARGPVSRLGLYDLAPYGRCDLLALDSLARCADSYLLHRPLSRGARLAKSPRARSTEEYVALSPWHGMLVTRRDAAAP
jgi:glycosyltransferase involved in cell wall biosynthesis